MSDNVISMDVKCTRDDDPVIVFYTSIKRMGDDASIFDLSEEAKKMLSHAEILAKEADKMRTRCIQDPDYDTQNTARLIEEYEASGAKRLRRAETLHKRIKNAKPQSIADVIVLLEHVCLDKCESPVATSLDYLRKIEAKRLRKIQKAEEAKWVIK